MLIIECWRKKMRTCIKVNELTNPLHNIDNLNQNFVIKKKLYIYWTFGHIVDTALDVDVAYSVLPEWPTSVYHSHLVNNNRIKAAHKYIYTSPSRRCTIRVALRANNIYDQNCTHHVNPGVQQCNVEDGLCSNLFLVTLDMCVYNKRIQSLVSGNDRKDSSIASIENICVVPQPEQTNRRSTIPDPLGHYYRRPVPALALPSGLNE